MNNYMPRIADKLIEEKLEAVGAVLIEGPKFCGKTTTGEQIAKSVLYMADPDTRERNIALATTNIKRLLTGDVPRLIDEWQIAPQLWDAIRFEVDHRRADGQFLLAGSAVPADPSKIFHSGTGRFGWVRMRTMSLWESGDSTGEVSMGEMFRNASDIDGGCDMNSEQLAYLICRGGWPKASLKKSRRAALQESREYVEAVCRSDISRVDGVSRNPERAFRILKSYARNQGGQVPISTIMADIKSNEESGLTEFTVQSYITALKKIFVIEDMAAWSPNLRSKTAIRTSDTRYFSDPSIATAALGLGPEDLLDDPNTFGLMFEAMAIRDLRVFADAIDGKVYHYRDKNGLECDAIVHLHNGKYGMVEIKLGGDALIESGAKTLKELAAKLDTDKMKAPSFMMILTGTGQYAYMRQDGIAVVPIGCLKD